MDWVDAISKAIQYIEEHITEELTADRISENINICQSHLKFVGLQIITNKS